VTQTAYDISVIICAYTQERWDDLIAAIESVQQQILPPKEIIVVIDHNPRLLERVRVHVPDVTVTENHEQQGLSGARNSGITIAQGGLIAFLDDDATAEPDWLIRLTHCCEDSQVLGTGGAVEPLWLGKRPAWFPEEFYWVVGCTYRGLPVELKAVRNPFGGCTCIRREVFGVVGGFRHSIGRVSGRPMGGEETEFCIRAKQRWPQKFFLYEPQAKIHHRIPSHRATWRYFRSRCYAEGLSKAIVARYVGAKDSLASERSYILRTLPRGIVQSLADALLREGLTGLARAGAIVLGLALTIAGYLVGSTLLYIEKLKTKRKNIIAREETFLRNLPPSIKVEP
jgi:GT2 family glycosyltransferase